MEACAIHPIKLGIATCYLLTGGAGASVLVDCGTAGQGSRFVRALKPLDLAPSSIRLIVITHTHYDHTGSAQEIATLTGAPVAVHEADRPYLERGVSAPILPLAGWLKPLASLMRGSGGRTPPVVPAVIFGDADSSLAPYGIPGRVIATPGHTAGSVSILLEDGRALIGDLAMSGFPQIPARPGLPVVGQDAAQVRESWRKLLDAGAKQLYPAHGKPFEASALRSV